MSWDYRRDEGEPREKLTGKQRCVIVAAEEGVSKAGNPMIIITIRPSGVKFTLKNFIVKNDNFNRNMTEFFDAFPEIEEGDFNFLSWVGAEGAVMLREDDNGYLKIRRWLPPSQVVNLPPFEGEKPARQTITSLDDEDDFDDGEIPF